MNQGKSDTSNVLTQIEGLSELIPGTLTHSVEDMNVHIAFAKQNIKVGSSLIVSGQSGYLATRDIRKGERVFSVFGTIISYQTEQHSIQIGDGVHVDPHTFGGRYINHHCEGNLIIEWDNRGLHHYVAAKDIKEGEEVSYPYWRTELKWSDVATENDILCSCGSLKCTGKILSFQDLKPSEQEKAFKEGGIAWYLYMIDKE